MNPSLMVLNSTQTERELYQGTYTAVKRANKEAIEDVLLLWHTKVKAMYASKS